MQIGIEPEAVGAAEAVVEVGYEVELRLADLGIGTYTSVQLELITEVRAYEEACTSQREDGLASLLDTDLLCLDLALSVTISDDDVLLRVLHQRRSARRGLTGLARYGRGGC